MSFSIGWLILPVVILSMCVMIRRGRAESGLLLISEEQKKLVLN